MGADIKALRNRIKSVDSTLHLTSAMGLVASSKIRRSGEAMKRSRQYAGALRDVADALTRSRDCEKSPYMRPSSGDIAKTCIIVIAGDRGLAGGYNANVMRLSAQYKCARFIPIGKRACDRFGGEVNSSEHYKKEAAYELAKSVCTDFCAGDIDRVGIIYTRYESMMTQTADIMWLLPLEKSESESLAVTEFEPDEVTVLDSVMPEYLTGIIMGAVRESFASETAARRVAMDNAGKNATAMLEELTISYNRARQGAITQEITEIVAGAGDTQ